MEQLWRGAGLTDVETRVITVERAFESFEDLWASVLPGPTLKNAMAGMPPAEAQDLKERARHAFPAGADGRITYPAWANAVKGRVA